MKTTNGNGMAVLCGICTNSTSVATLWISVQQYLKKYKEEKEERYELEIFCTSDFDQEEYQEQCIL